MVGNRMNHFCLYCTGNDNEEVEGCEDRYCPFCNDRFTEFSKEGDKEIAMKLLGSLGVKSYEGG